MKLMAVSYHVHRPSGSSGGGVVIYVKNVLQSEACTDFSMCDENVELCSVKIILPSIQYIGSLSTQTL